MRVYFHTFGCKANQYDSERMRQELEARGAAPAEGWEDADVCVVNTCTVTSRADAEARRVVRKMRRENPEARIVVAGCSAALKAPEYRRMKGVVGVVKGQDPLAVAGAVERSGAPGRGLRRGASRSRSPGRVVREARALARRHPELVLTGIHIGHYGRDLSDGLTLSRLLARLLDEVPDVRLRLGSVEATEIDDLLLELLATSGGRVAPHLHMPLQSGADPVLRRMRRWHTRAQYRGRALEIAARMPVLGLGADIITGFPGESEDDHARTRALVEELPYTYVHVFPFSPREDTPAAELARRMPVPERVAGERSRELRELVREKGRRHRERRVGDEARVVLEAGGSRGLTGDYLRVPVRREGAASAAAAPDRRPGLHRGTLRGRGDDLYIDLSRESP